MKDFFLICSRGDHQKEIVEDLIFKARAFFKKYLSGTFQVFNKKNIAVLLADQINCSSKLCRHDSDNTLFAWKGGWFYSDRANSTRDNPDLFLKSYNSDVNLIELMEGIDGVFNFIILEQESCKITVINDRLGIAPIFYRKINDLDLVSSSCLLLASLDSSELDYTGIMEFILTGKNFKDRTLFKGVKKLNAASIYEFSSRKNKITQYWDMHYGERDTALSQDDKVEFLKYEMDKIGRGIAGIYSDPYIDLTGGWDSRANILSLIDHVSGLVTTTLGSKNDHDVIIAKQIAEMLGLEHKQHISYLISPDFTEEHYIELLEKSLFLTDGCMSAPLYTNILNSQLINSKTGCDVSINGSGGELYRQYWWEPTYFIYSDFKKLKFSITGKTQYFDNYQLAKRVITQNSSLSIFSKIFPADIYNHMYDLFDTLNKPYGDICNIDQISNVYLNFRMKNWLAGYYTSTLRITDCLSPLLMKGPLEVSTQLSFKDKLFNSFFRKYITDRNYIISSLDLETNAPTLPVSYKNINRFVPGVRQTFSKTAEKIIQRMGFASKQPQEQIKKLSGNPNLEIIRKVHSLHPENMKLLDIFEKKDLKNFIFAYQSSADFPYKEQYENIFTIEAILERIVK